MEDERPTVPLTVKVKPAGAARVADIQKARGDDRSKTLRMMLAFAAQYMPEKWAGERMVVRRAAKPRG